jgi:hypothetical protein
MINRYKRLVLTPKNYKDESLMGFLLRTAEMNVYQSPFALLGLSGLSESQTRNIRPSIEIVASLYGRPPEEFLEIDNNIPGNSSRSKGWKLIGKEVPSIYINAKRPRICPECIQEKGYMSSSRENSNRYMSKL